MRHSTQRIFKKLLPILHSSDVQTSGFGAQTTARWTATRDILVDLGLVEHPPAVDALFTTRFSALGPLTSKPTVSIAAIIPCPRVRRDSVHP